MKNKILIPALCSMLFAGSAQALMIEYTDTTGGEAGGTPVNQDIYAVTIGSGDIGSSFTMNWGFNGMDNVSADALFTVSGFSGNSAGGFLILDVNIHNTSIATIDANPTIMSMGFNINPGINSMAISDSGGATDNDVFTDYALDTNFPAFQSIDICVFAQNCTGGGVGGGLHSDETDAFTLALLGDFSGHDSITLDTFAMKFQGMDSYELPGQGSCAGSSGCISVPEPSSLLLLSLGLLGMRRLARRG